MGKKSDSFPDDCRQLEIDLEYLWGLNTNQYDTCFGLCKPKKVTKIVGIVNLIFVLILAGVYITALCLVSLSLLIFTMAFCSSTFLFFSFQQKTNYRLSNTANFSKTFLVCLWVLKWFCLQVDYISLAVYLGLILTFSKCFVWIVVAKQKLLLPQRAFTY